MIRAYRWDRNARTGEWVTELPATAAESCAEGVVWWVDLAAPSPEEEARVFKEWLPVHPLTLEDIDRLRRVGGMPHLPKVEEFRDYLFVIVNPLPVSDNRAVAQSWPPTQLSAVLTRQVLITHHFEPLSAVDMLTKFIERHTEQCDRGPDYLFHLVLDAEVDNYAPLLDRVVETLEEVEEDILKPTGRHRMEQLLHVKRRVLGLRKTLVLEREVLARLSRGEFELVDERETVYYRNVLDHLVRYTELTETAREMVSDLMQSHLAASSNRLNEVMKVLTMISTVVLPMTLVAGVYGMNFKHMPELEWAGGYPFALGLMAVVGAGAFGLFRYKKWI